MRKTVGFVLIACIILSSTLPLAAAAKSNQLPTEQQQSKMLLPAETDIDIDLDELDASRFTSISIPVKSKPLQFHGLSALTSADRIYAFQNLRI